jgi:hypothetical protein
MYGLLLKVRVKMATYRKNACLRSPPTNNSASIFRELLFTTSYSFTRNAYPLSPTHSFAAYAFHRSSPSAVNTNPKMPHCPSLGVRSTI